VARSNQPPPVLGNSSPPFEGTGLREVAELDFEDRFAYSELRVSELDAPGAAAHEGVLSLVELVNTNLEGSRLHSLKLSDANVLNIRASNSDWSYSRLVDVTFTNCALVGLTLADGHIRSTTFRGCKLDLANLRHCALRDVTFESCSLRSVDLYGATLSGVRIDDCDLVESDFRDVNVRDLDLRGSRLLDLHGVTSLKGSIIDFDQLVELAPSLALEAGFIVAADADG
jgi:uncharacterized protein YjbI with pentapeptide repeats